MNNHFIRGVYAGSFDPLTQGHMYMITEGSKLFDQLIIAIGINPGKSYTFDIDERVDLIKESTKHLNNIVVETFENRFLVKYAEEKQCKYIIRGIRSESDYEFERTMRNVNGDLNSEISTVFLMPPRGMSEISSSFVKGLVGPEGWQTVIKSFLPDPVYYAMIKRFTVL
ncbi:MAG: pantetheine-phosphate adenylyltransferase [Candidatus Sericytochromatia bacterium]|nr:pantetheine-phosphate adenylyltransferase [Candidatus Sericytochromatia bacterium]